MISKDEKIFIAGHNGMVGSACSRALNDYGFKNIIFKSSSELDLRNELDVKNFLKKYKPSIIINAAAKVGGILANDSYPFEFLMDNMLIQNNLIKYSHHFNVDKFIFLGSSCIYPKYSKQPIKEEYLLSGTLEPTNQWYAVAKISGLKLIESLRKQYKRDYVSLMPTNLYGINDNFNLKTSHVLPALIRKFHDAKKNKSQNVKLWGTGSPKREFLHVDDLASAVIFALENKMKKSIYNIGTGKEISIKELAEIIKKIVGFGGDIYWDKTKPDGTPKKLLDVSRFTNLGWNYKIKLKKGITQTYNWYKKNLEKVRK